MSRKTFIPVAGIELALCLVSYVLALYWTDGGDRELLIMDSRLPAVLACGLAVWFRLYTTPRARGIELLEPVTIGAGMTMMIGALIGYSGWTEPLPLDTLAGGIVLSTLCVLLVRTWTPLEADTLLIGCGAVGREILRQKPKMVMGVVASDRNGIPEGVPYLGGYGQLAEILEQQQPPRVVVDLPEGKRALPPQALLDYKLRGGEIETDRAAYERFFNRIYLPSFGMANLLRAETQRANRRVMALQAVYSNPIGLVLLVLLSPVLVLLGIVSRQAAGGGGPLFERVECAGFQAIPFERRRFWLRHAETGKKTTVGKWIERLGIVYLPQIINLNRGEMALFGPEPIRMVFSQYLDTVSPLHVHRLSVKPGIFGWERAHAGARGSLPEEHERIAYDFFYVERGSPVIDIEIWFRFLGSATGLWRNEQC